jgi:hypothetical protein
MRRRRAIQARLVAREKKKEAGGLAEREARRERKNRAEAVMDWLLADDAQAESVVKSLKVGMSYHLLKMKRERKGEKKEKKYENTDDMYENVAKDDPSNCVCSVTFFFFLILVLFFSFFYSIVSFLFSYSSFILTSFLG